MTKESGTGLRGKVLLVEDSDLIRSMVAKMLGNLGLWVTEASNGSEARTAFESAEAPFDLLLTDGNLGDTTGTELARGLIQRAPGMRVICMSGYTEDSFLPDHGHCPGFRFISKPFSRQVLRQMIAELLT